MVEIQGYEGRYLITRAGLVYSKVSSKFLKQAKDKDGYSYVGLSKNGKKRNHKLHRLVAEAFIPNPENKPQVNHIDGVKRNNSIKNLEWATCSENNLHKFRILDYTPWNKGKSTSNAHTLKFGEDHPKHIGKWSTPNGVFDTARRAAQENNIKCHKTVIRRCKSENYEGWCII